MRLNIINTDGELIADNLSNQCKDCYDKCSLPGNLISDCPIYGGNRRQGKLKNSNGIIFLCSNRTKTTKLFRAELDALSYTIPNLITTKKEIEEKARFAAPKKISRLIHNLTSVNAHNIQEVYDLVSQEILSLNWKNQIRYIEQQIKNNTTKAARMFLKITKNNLQMKSEFSIYRKLERDELPQLEFNTYTIRNVLLNVLHTFFVDFNINEINVDVKPYNGKVYIDYETVQVAFYHFIDNASKYSKHNSKIEIEFTEEPKLVKMLIQMKSAIVEADEYQKVFDEGYSGKMAIKMNKKGDGIGLWRIKQIMELNKGDFKATFGNATEENFKDYVFADNTFLFTFRKP